jgi:hypothetical protein
MMLMPYMLWWVLRYTLKVASDDDVDTPIICYNESIVFRRLSFRVPFRAKRSAHGFCRYVSTMQQKTGKERGDLGNLTPYDIFDSVRVDMRNTLPAHVSMFCVFGVSDDRRPSWQNKRHFCSSGSSAYLALEGIFISTSGRKIIQGALWCILAQNLSSLICHL